jgi:hypothetical protein
MLSKKGKFNLDDTIRQILGFVAVSDAPLLQARAFTCAAAFAKALPPALVIQLLEASLGRLTAGAAAPVQISAIHAIRAFCEALVRPETVCSSSLCLDSPRQLTLAKGFFLNGRQRLLRNVYTDVLCSMFAPSIVTGLFFIYTINVH